jgi:hypothetical protein
VSVVRKYRSAEKIGGMSGKNSARRKKYGPCRQKKSLVRNETRRVGKKYRSAKKIRVFARKKIDEQDR